MLRQMTSVFDRHLQEPTRIFTRWLFYMLIRSQPDSPVMACDPISEKVNHSKKMKVKPLIIMWFFNLLNILSLKFRTFRVATVNCPVYSYVHLSIIWYQCPTLCFTVKMKKIKKLERMKNQLWPQIWHRLSFINSMQGCDYYNRDTIVRKLYRGGWNWLRGGVSITSVLSVV